MKILDLLFDRRCKLCGQKISSGVVCCECDSKLLNVACVRKRTIEIDGAEYTCTYLFDYQCDVVKKLLFALKRSANSELFEYASKFYAMAVEDFEGTVTFVPRRKVSKRYYGYDHAEKCCRAVCKTKGDKLRFAGLIKRRGFSKDQKNLSSASREINARNAFKCAKKDIPENILLMDDVITTGNTVKSCIGEMQKAKGDVKICLAFLASSI